MKEQNKAYAITIVALAIALWVAALFANAAAVSRVQPYYDEIYGEEQCENLNK